MVSELHRQVGALNMLESEVVLDFTGDGDLTAGSELLQANRRTHGARGIHTGAQSARTATDYHDVKVLFLSHDLLSSISHVLFAVSSPCNRTANEKFSAPRRGYQSTPFWASRPCWNGCLISVISVTRSGPLDQPVGRTAAGDDQMLLVINRVDNSLDLFPRDQPKIESDIEFIDDNQPVLTGSDLLNGQFDSLAGSLAVLLELLVVVDNPHEPLTDHVQLHEIAKEFQNPLSSPYFQLPLTNWIMQIRHLYPAARMHIPSEAVVFPLPLPV